MAYQEITDRQSKIWQVLDRVPDPEIPVLSVTDLGIVRQVFLDDQKGVEVIITPTYSGCPAMNMIEVNLKSELQDAGYDPISIKTVLHPAWTTDWMTERGKLRLKKYGIAPPQGASSDKLLLFREQKIVPCPRCGSNDTELISEFGSTACKSFYKCRSCMEPFDYFKCH